MKILHMSDIFVHMLLTIFNVDSGFPVLAVVLLIAVLVILHFASGTKRQTWNARDRRRGRWYGARRDLDIAPQTTRPYEGGPKSFDAADQLRIVMCASFTAQPLLNSSEARVFRELDRIVASCNPAWQVMAQVSMGEILRSTDANAYRCINSKRIDLLLIDENCRPRHAMEYQGGAHYQGTAAIRDAVKKEALRRAGIGYHEVVSGRTTPSELQRLVEKLVDKPMREPSTPRRAAGMHANRVSAAPIGDDSTPSTDDARSHFGLREKRPPASCEDSTR
jgi:Protein of unknown function (DUF2726)